MTSNKSPHQLISATEIEALFGSKYFYRQKVYRLADKGKLPDFELKGKRCFIASLVLKRFLEELKRKLRDNHPEINWNNVEIFYDTINEKRIVIDGVAAGGTISVKTDEENEEDLLKKVESLIEWLSSSNHSLLEDEDDDTEVQSELQSILPEEILWVRVDTAEIKGIEIKSLILISLPSVAQFIGTRTNNLTDWISKSTFSEYVLSAHYKHIQGAGHSAPWKKGVHAGLTPLVPFELLPEIIVSLRQSNIKTRYSEKAELLYNLSKNTLEAVGIAVSGNRDRAAKELAKVGEGLGLTVAEQIIGIFKQYETREFQVQTTKEFQGKLKELGADYAVTIGKMTLGITERWPSQWKALGTSRNLPKKISNSSRETMREVSPADGVGMTFGERHYIKDPNLSEAIETGKQGKGFYKRLKDVGLLNDNSTDQN